MKKLPNLLIKLGFLAIIISGLIFILTFYPLLRVELTYDLKIISKPLTKPMEPVDTDFGILIPKISANAKVISDVDPYNSQAYQLALTKGVAQAKGTVFPGELGNLFIFSHSSVNFYEAVRFNSIFYLLDKLEKGDEIDLYYKKEKFKYLVTEKKLVDPSEVKYLSGAGTKKTVTLMTCWPPGTTFKRLIVIGQISP